MLTVKIESNMAEKLMQLDGFSARRINATIATTLSRTAALARDAAREELIKVIEGGPTEYTKRGIFMRGANANKLEAKVWYQDEWRGSNTPQARYLYPQVEGGGRALKRFEKALQAKGAMPTGMFCVPASGAKIDSHGNVSRGQIQQIISQLGTELLAGYNRTLRQKPGESAKSFKQRKERAWSKAGGQYVSILQPRGRLKPGVYKAVGHNPGARSGGFVRSGQFLPVFFFVRSVRYTPRYKFYDVVNRAAQHNLPIQFERTMKEQNNALANRRASAYEMEAARRAAF